MKSYLLSIVAAAVIGGVVTKLLGSKGSQGAMGKLIAGLFLVFTVISPLRNIHIDSLSLFSDAYAIGAQEAVLQGQTISSMAIGERIKQNCEAYILDKARQLDANLEVSVTLDDASIPAPVAVNLKGNVSPNTKKTLQAMIAEDLGIPKEAQIWS